MALLENIWTSTRDYEVTERLFEVVSLINSIAERIKYTYP